jgi:RIO-like serine/threonine protein kinase
MDEQRMKRIYRASVSVAWAYAEKLTADQSFAKALERLRSELAPAPSPREETKHE